MSLSTIIVGLAVLVVISGIAYALYKAGFSLTKIKAKGVLLEAELERSPAQTSKPAPDAPPAPAQFSQEASAGGVIRKSSLEAPADSAASAAQKAAGDGSRLDDSHIKLS